jgi:hypothetical protein
MKKILLLLLISISGYSQTLLKLKAIEYAPGAGYCVITNTAGVQTYTPCSSLSSTNTVQSVTGNNVDNTDPLNPVINAWIISNDNNTAAYAYDGQLNMVSSDGASNASSLILQPTDATISVTDGTNTATSAFTPTLITLDATSVKKNGNEIATTNQLPTITASTNITVSGTTPNYTISATSSSVALNYVTPEMYGAVGNGSTDDATALQNAINTGSLVVGDLNKTYLSLSTLTLTANKTLRDINLRLTSNIVGVSIEGNYNELENCSITGTTSLGHGAANYGVSIVGNAGLTSYRIGNKISRCYFNNLNTAIYTASIVGTSSGSKHEGALTIDGSFIENCTNGIFFDSRAEYNNTIGTKIASCTDGIIIRGGNNNYTGGQITDCTNGFVLQSGTNDAHSVASGVMINHNTLNVLGSQSLSYTFDGCMFYGGNIQLTGAGKTRFVGSEFSMGANTFSINASPSFFEGCEFIAMPSSASITGVSPKVSACYTGTNSVADLSTTSSGAYAFNNGSAAVNVMTIYDNGTPKMAIQDGGHLQFVDAVNIVAGTTTGTKIGTATTQKLGFFNATPIVQVAATTDLGTVLSNLGLRASGTAYPITTSGAVTLTGGLRLGYVAKTSSYTITTTDYLIDCTANTFTVTLPTAASVSGKIYEITNSGAGTITIATTSSQTFTNVTATPTTLSLAATLAKSIRVMSNGANWLQLN